MTINVNAFLGKWPFENLLNSDSEKLKKLMKKEHVDKALVSPIEGIFYRDCQQANENLFKNIKKNHSLIPVAVINPTLDNWEECIDKNLRIYKIKGIKLHPNYHSYSLNNKNLKLMLKKLEELHLPVIFQIRMEDRRTQHPLMQVPDLDVKEILKSGKNFPNLPIILGGILYTEVKKNMALLLKRKNVFIEISFIETLDCVRKVIDLIGYKKILFGTHCPFFYITSAILKVKEADLSSEESGAILADNASNIFNIR